MPRASTFNARMTRSVPPISAVERSFLEAVSKLAYCNPFLPERIEYEREALGEHFTAAEPIWSMNVDDPDRPRASLVKISSRLERTCELIRDLLARGVSLNDRDLELYEVGVLFLLYRRYEEFLHATIVAELETKSAEKRYDCYVEFLRNC